MYDLKIDVYTHYFKVSAVQGRAWPTLDAFARKKIQWGWKREGRRVMRVAVKVFAASTKSRREYRFHINELTAFRDALWAAYIRDEKVLYTEHPVYEPASVKLTVAPGWTPRPEQLAPIEHLVTPPPPRSKLIQIQTGKGKSALTLMAAAQVGARQCYVIKPGYIDKWLIDIYGMYEDVAPENVLVVQGSASLMALLRMATEKELDNCKIILFSNKTFQNWIKEYEEHEEKLLEMGYDCLPDQFFEHVGATWKVVDEGHLDFHFFYKLDLYTHVPQSTTLTATLISDDDFITRQHCVMFPPHLRLDPGELDKYIASTAIFFSLQQPEHIRYTGYDKRYSHNTFEASVMRNKVLLREYNELIARSLDKLFLDKSFYKKGDKATIFAYSVDYCSVLVEFLRQRFPELTTRRYCPSEGDDYTEDLLAPEIRVTTLIAAGAAVDVKGLTCTILTQALATSAGNIQGLGRLRKLDDGRTPRFGYFVCRDIPKHIDYHMRKRKILEERAESYTVVEMGQLQQYARR